MLRSQGKIYNNSDFAAKIGKNRSYVSECMNGRRPVTDFLARDIARVFPEVNPRWLTDADCDQMLNSAGDPFEQRGKTGEVKEYVYKPEGVDMRILYETIKKQQAQIDRLLGIIEKMQG